VRERARGSEHGGERAETPAPARPPTAPAATVLVLQRSAGNQGVARAIAARRRVTELGRNRALVQRMQTPLPVKEKEDEDQWSETDSDGEADAVEQQTLSPHDRMVASDLAKINAPDDERNELDPTLAAGALAGLGLDEPPPLVDELEVMEETLRMAVELGIDAKDLQGYKKRLQELKVDRVVKASNASAQELSSILREGEAVGLTKAVLDPLRLKVLTLDMRKRCDALQTQAQPLQTQAQQVLGSITPLKIQIDQLHTIILLHPRSSWESVIDCRKEAAGLQQQMTAAHKEFDALLTVCGEMLDAATAELPMTLTALRKRQNKVEAQEQVLEEQKPRFTTARAAHQNALAADGAMTGLADSITLRFRNLCLDYVDQEPYLVAYNALYDDECRNYLGLVLQLKGQADGLIAQTVTGATAKQIVKLVNDCDLTVKYDEFLTELIYWFKENLGVTQVMRKMLDYKKTLFYTHPVRGKIGIQHLLTLGDIRLTHKATYRDISEKAEKKGQQYGPFSRAFWVNVTPSNTRCDWVVHVHYHSNAPTALATAGNIDKMHAKLTQDEKKKGAALADWTDKALLQTLVTSTAKSAHLDQKSGVA
jgi:hypothetical protein